MFFCYADKHFQPIKQEPALELQDELNVLQNEARENEAPLLTRRVFKGIHLFMQEKGSRGQWRWILRSPLLSLAISRGRLSCVITQVNCASQYIGSLFLVRMRLLPERSKLSGASEKQFHTWRRYGSIRESLLPLC